MNSLNKTGFQESFGENLNRRGEKLSNNGIAKIIFLHFDKNCSKAEIIRKTGYVRKTVDKYIELFNKGGTDACFEKKTKECSGIHTQPDNVEYINQLANNCPGLTLEGMKMRYELFFEISISISMIFHILKNTLGFSYNKITPIEIARTNPEIMALHDEFVCFI